MRSPGSDSESDFAATFEGTTATINGARQRVGTWLASRAVEARDIEIAQLIVSELVSNAIEASGPEPYEVSASLVDQRLRLVVANRSARATIPDPDSWSPATVLAARGRGLGIVQALAEDVDIAVGDGRVSVAVRLAVALAD